MIRLNEIPVGISVNGIMYAGAKVGKTWLFGTAGDRALHITTGTEYVTWQSPGFIAKHGRINPIIEIVNERALFTGDKAEAFDKVCDIIDYYLDKESDKFDYIFVDGVTSLKKFAKNKGMEINQEGGITTSLGKAKANKGFSISQPTDTFREMELIERFTATYVDITREHNKHFFIAAHLRETFKKADKKFGAESVLIKVRPGFSGETFPDAVTQYFDLVWLMEPVRGGTGYHVRYRTVGDSVVTAGTRYAGVFKDTEQDLTMPQIVDRIQKGIKVNA